MFSPRFMRHTLLLFLVMGMLLGTISSATAVVVTFPDANLEAAIRTELNIPTAPITDVNMKSIGQFTADFSNITNMMGLEHATNLSTLSLGSNQISDISAVVGLINLNTLRLHNNQIVDISAISGLTNLGWLNMGGNQISDASALAALTNLSTLRFWANQVSDISAFSKLTNLTDLNLGYNRISNVQAIAGLTKLTSLALNNNQISDISVVAELTNLNALSLGHNQISDISAVAGLANLNSLHLDYDRIETLNLCNSNLLFLQRLSIKGNPLASVLFTDAMLNQNAFNAFMDGGDSYWTGIAELDGVLNMDMSGVDFTEISDLSKMYTMDDLETLLLARATNLEGSEVVALTNELD